MLCDRLVAERLLARQGSTAHEASNSASLPTCSGQAFVHIWLPPCSGQPGVHIWLTAAPCMPTSVPCSGLHAQAAAGAAAAGRVGAVVTMHRARLTAFIPALPKLCTPGRHCLILPSHKHCGRQNLIDCLPSCLSPVPHSQLHAPLRLPHCPLAYSLHIQNSMPAPVSPSFFPYQEHRSALVNISRAECALPDQSPARLSITK